MFDLTTILTLIAPAVVAPVICLVALRALEHGDRAQSLRVGTSEVATIAAPEAHGAERAERAEPVAEPVGRAQAA